MKAYNINHIVSVEQKNTNLVLTLIDGTIVDLYHRTTEEAQIKFINITKRLGNFIKH